METINIVIFSQTDFTTRKRSLGNLEKSFVQKQNKKYKNGFIQQRGVFFKGKYHYFHFCILDVAFYCYHLMISGTKINIIN